MSYKIVHCGIFNEYNDGEFFYGLERKISHGLHQNGHFVYDFSYRDWERNLRFLGLKNSGLKKMNKKLINICKNLQPDVLLFAKAEKIDILTIKEIKKILPNIKIALWYVDHLKEKDAFFEKLNLLDAFFYANALNLQHLSSKYNKPIFSFFPNISDMAFEKSLNLQKDIDILYIARDHKEDNRYKFAKLLDEFCKKEHIKHKIYASLGNKPIFGNDFIHTINRAKIAINFNRDDKLDCTKSNKLLGASDRMAQFMGCGTCTFSPIIEGLGTLINDEEVVYFKDFDDCTKKIKEYLQDEKYESIGKKGQQKAFKIANAQKVTKFFLDTLFERDLPECQWKNHMYRNGEKI